MKHPRIIIRNITITIFLLTSAFSLCLLGDYFFDVEYIIPAVFALFVYLISLLTDGYFWGIAASLFSVIAVNYAFTFPYFKINFHIRENLVSGVIMLAITIITSTLSTKIRAQEKMQAESEKEKMRANLLRAISHDLRTPLTTIYGASSAIIENYDKFTKEQNLELLEGIREESTWLTHMVENLLSVTRIDGKDLALLKTPVVLEELIDSALVKFQKRYPGQKVHLELPEEFVSIAMDPVLMEQVLLNLLENSTKHATGMTRLTLRIELHGKHVSFAVEDDGIGFEKNEIGVGLSVCEAIVKAHGGVLKFRNRPTGGAIVFFTLLQEDEANHVE